MKRDHRGRVTTRTAATHRGANARSSLVDHPVELCRYPNKRCWSARVLKDNGELHSFCEWHRNCANQYQRRLEQRRRNQKLNVATSSAAEPGSTAAAAADASAQLELPPKPNMCIAGIQSIAEATSRAIAATADTVAAAAPTQGTPSAKDKDSETAARTAATIATAAAAKPVTKPGARLSSAAARGDEYEPFQSPVPLQIEDLQYLSLCFPEAGAGGDS